MIIEYDSKYDGEIKDLLVQLQEYIVSIDKEKYNIIGNDYREKYFKKTMTEIKSNDGKIILYEDDQKIVGLIVGIVNNDEINEYDFASPKRGRITEFIVDRNYRGKGIGNLMLQEMEKYFETINCKKIMIEVFGYNESAVKFYEKNGFHIRMLNMITS